MSSSQRTALISHPACALHDTGWNHPEHQGRLPAITRALYSQTPDLLERVVQAEAEMADLGEILRVHTLDHVERVRTAVDRARQAERPVEMTMDTVVSAASWDAALGAAGAAVHAARVVLDDDVDTSFALTRPPGHHATASRAMGFCLFNSVAIAARWAQAERDVERVLIIDWDVHHGNGTQDIFYGDGSVYYLSLHLSGHYPGTGHTHQKGMGPGEGTTRNIPFPAGVERGYYLEVFEEAMEVAADFSPGLVLVSAGFDCLAGDPLGGLMLEPKDLHRMTRIVVDSTRATADGRVAVLLEGGYEPKRVAAGVVETVRGLADLPVSGSSSD